MCLVIVLAIVSAAPKEDGILADLPGSDVTNPEDPNSILKLLLLKKLNIKLLLG